MMAVAFTSKEELEKWIKSIQFQGPFCFCALIDKHFVFTLCDPEISSIETLYRFPCNRMMCQ